jgi:hypothetical protein
MKSLTLWTCAALIALAATTLPSRAQTVLYSNNFDQNGSPATYADQNLKTVNFVGDVTDRVARVFSNTDNLNPPAWAIFSYAQVGATEGFYTAPGVLKPISTTTPGLKFSVDIQSQFQPENVTSYFAIETSDKQWYVSATALPTATDTFTTASLDFSPTAAKWNVLTPGSPSGDATDSGATIGSTAPGDLKGDIIAAGFVAVHANSNGTVNFDNFSITTSGK